MLSATLPVYNVEAPLEPKVHVVIPIYNSWQMVHSLLWDLFRKEKENIASITLVNDCSTDPEVEGGIKWWCSEYGGKYPIRSITNEENKGFLLSANIGIMSVKEGLYDPIILLSTDVQVHGKFISQIVDILESNSKSLVGGILYNQDTGWNKFDRIYPYLEGWLLATTLENWFDLGYFDERYIPHDYEDLDLSTKALSMGYELIPLNNPGIRHLGGKSIGYSDERFAQTKINQEKFKNKWLSVS